MKYEGADRAARVSKITKHVDDFVTDGGPTPSGEKKKLIEAIKNTSNSFVKIKLNSKAVPVSK